MSTNLRLLTLADPAPMSRSRPARWVRALRGLALVLAVMTSAGVCGALVGWSAHAVSGNRMAPWIIGRAAGISAYLLMVVLVLFGLFLSHPSRARLRWPSTATRIRVHIVVSVFTLAFVVLHVVVLATDRYAGVGWPGALLPMHATYRPVATTLGLIGLWSGLLAGITAAFAGRLPLRLWWPIHKTASIALILVWLHGVLGGGDSHVLLGMYLVTAGVVTVVALSRYTARTRADRITELILLKRPR
jgi:hypothetical protein